MMVQSSVHPILNQTCAYRPMPNDIIASIHGNVCMITGPNMGGKSIYIRQVALLQIMAQIGCFVPANTALFRLTDSIFSRIGFEDNIECNASTFIVEIKEMLYILQHVTPRSIVIIDELCRGTCTEEGTALAWAITEELLATSAFTFFATHFFYLTKLEDLYCNVQNYHFEAIEVNSATDALPFLTYTHRLVTGVLRLENYGLKLARSTAIPDKILQFARNVVQILTLTWKACSIANECISVEKRIDAIIVQLLELMDNGSLNIHIVDELIEYVNEMKLLSTTASETQLQQPPRSERAMNNADAGNYNNNLFVADTNSSSSNRRTDDVVSVSRSSGRLPESWDTSIHLPIDGELVTDDSLDNSQRDDESNNDDANSPSNESSHLEARAHTNSPSYKFCLLPDLSSFSDYCSSTVRSFNSRLNIRRRIRRDCFTE